MGFALTTGAVAHGQQRNRGAAVFVLAATIARCQPEHVAGRLGTGLGAGGGGRAAAKAPRAHGGPGQRRRSGGLPGHEWPATR